MATSKTKTSATSSAQEAVPKTKLVVGAIDFGTTYSGFAYAFKNDPTKIQTNNWNNQNFLSLKTTTSILFNKGTFNSFGFDADRKYTAVLEKEEGKNDDSDSDSDDDEKHKDKPKAKEELIYEDCQYFNRFKMMLYRELQSLDGNPSQYNKRKITKAMKLKDGKGGTMEAFNVFVSAIAFLKNKLMSSIQSRVPNILPDDVCWVLTIPAIWTDTAKQFMREAAEAAGIKSNSLTLALEPEAAAIYCKEEIVQKQEKEECDESDLLAFRPGQKFLVLDMGGGTVDITISEVLKNGHLKEIRTASGGPWGGTMVDEEYFRFLKDLFGENVWKKFVKRCPSAKLDIESDFEIKKRNFQPNSDEDMIIRCPAALFHQSEKVNGTKLKRDLKADSHKYKSVVSVSRDKLKIKSMFVSHFFTESKNRIISHLEGLFQEESTASVDTILMVGGFAGSEYMQTEIRNAFTNKNVIVPSEAGLAVLKGAVTYGFNPLIISERKSPRTYGISVNVPFDETIHPSKLKCEYDGSQKCTDVFLKMVTIGQPLVVNETVFEHVCHPTRAYDITANVDIYESLLENPKYTIDAGCTRLGSLCLDIPDLLKGKNRKIRIKMHFGHTEIFVSAHEEGTSNFIRTKCNCLKK